jgi:hypothetical protein
LVVRMKACSTGKILECFGCQNLGKLGQNQ